MTDNIKLPLVKATDHPEPRVMQWSALELAEINRLMREAVRLNAQVTGYGPKLTPQVSGFDTPAPAAPQPPQPAQAVPDAAAEFNRAIDFAIEQGSEAASFLRSWREGDVSEWPEFPQLLSAAPQPVQSAGNHRPDRQWYERMIQETLDDDFEIGPAFDEKVKDSAAPAAPQPAQRPLTVPDGFVPQTCPHCNETWLMEAQQPLTDEQIYGLYKRAGLEIYHIRDSVVQRTYDKCINDFARAIEQAHRIGVKP